MKRFNFPLERVRRWRAEQANVEELKLGRLRSELGQIESLRGAIQDEVKLAESRVLSQPSIDAKELTSLGSYRLHLGQKIRGIENRVREYQAKIIEQRERLIEARRQAELLERLREKALGQWRAAANKEQEDLASELFLAKQTRNR
jgi:flagellar export protein FliJ